MAEISKQFKIVLIINAIGAFIYAFQFLVITDIYIQLVDEPWPNPHLLRLWGATILILGIFALIAVKRAEWEKIKIMVELAIVWLLAVAIINLASLAYVPRTATNIPNAVLDVIVPLILFIIDVYFYRQVEKG